MPAPSVTSPSADESGLELKAEGLSKSFGHHTVLRSLGLEIRSGEIVAIVGGSGSGKTVLLDILTGLIPPDSGRVLVRNHARPGLPLVDLHATDPDTRDEIRLHWSVVFQRNALFSGTVYDNIALWFREHTDWSEARIEARARASLAAAALDVDDVLRKQREELSGGMAKRVAIARALSVEPVVMFYDEPTTGLDPMISGQIHELIFNEHHRPHAGGMPRTTVIVTHDKDLLRRLEPRIIMLHKASIVFDGTYEGFGLSTHQAPREYLQAMPVLHARELPDAK